MSLRQLAALAICNLGIFTLGIMALGLLPIYAIQLGMDEGAVGVYLGIAFGFLSAGALVSGRLSDRFQRRKLTIILVSIVGIPATFLMGQVSSLILLTICTLIVWLAAGVGMAMISILAGMYAHADQRGRVFGVLATSVALANVIAGTTAGPIADRWGYSGLYTATALVWLVTLGAALLLRDDKVTRPPGDQPKAAVPLGAALWLLIGASILASIPNFTSGMARPLIMDGLGFDGSAITSTNSVSGLVALPLPFLIGWLSDRIGRRLLLIAAYLLASASMLVLIPAVELWQFWLSTSLVALTNGAAGVGNAYVIDLSPPEALSTALAWFSATGMIAGIFGFGATGVIIQQFGLTGTLLFVAALPVVAILMLISIRRSVPVAAA